MSDPEKTVPPMAKLKAANKKADPFADRLMGRIQGSEYTAVLIAAIVIGLILFGVWVSR